jgi:hypothetical protein
MMYLWNTPWKGHAEVGGSPCVLHELRTLARSLEEAIMYWRSLRLGTGGLQIAEQTVMVLQREQQGREAW